MWHVASILLVCTANMCRSPLAEAMLAHLLDDASRSGAPMPQTRVSSAGFLADGQPAHPDTRAAAAEIGIDLSAHRSRTLTRELLATDGADLVVTMTRRHLREVSVMDPGAWPRAVTLRDLVRRIGAGTGPLATMLATRRPRDMAADDPADDISDPVGLPLDAHRALVAEMRQLLPVVAGWWRRYGDTL